MTPRKWLAERAVQVPDRIAVADEVEELTYAGLDRAAEAQAALLREQGLKAGEEMTIAMPAGMDYAVLLHALIKVGAIAVPVSPDLNPGELPAPEPVDPGTTAAGEGLDALHCRILTSGTTAAPRSVGLSYRNHLWSAAGSGFALGVEPDDRWLCCVPLFHVSGLMILLRSLVNGTTAEVHDGFDSDRVAAALERGEVTLVSLVATQLRRLLEADADLSAPRAIVAGGGPIPAEMLEEALGRGATVVQTYGMTETDSQVATLAPIDAKRKLGSAGRPLLSSELRIADAGEILVRGPVVAPGVADADGWLHTGDLGRLDDEGFLYVTGRAADTIITGGENVLPLEVEEVLLRHPAVADAAVVGRPDPEWQEAVTAIVVLVQGQRPSDDELREHCAAALPAFKVPKRFEFANEVPRSAGGKLLRSQIA